MSKHVYILYKQNQTIKKETFPSHDECIKHIGENSQCQIEIKHIGQTFCFVCERSYETVSFFLSLIKTI